MAISLRDTLIEVHILWEIPNTIKARSCATGQGIKTLSHVQKFWVRDAGSSKTNLGHKLSLRTTHESDPQQHRQRPSGTPRSLGTSVHFNSIPLCCTPVSQNGPLHFMNIYSSQLVKTSRKNRSVTIEATPHPPSRQCRSTAPEPNLFPRTAFHGKLAS